MPLTIDRIRVERYKKNRIEGKSKTKSMINAGFALSTATDRCGDNVSVLIGERELKEEIDKRGLAEKAYKRLEDCLNSTKESDVIASATAILRFTDGEIVNNKGDKEVNNTLIVLRDRLNTLLPSRDKGNSL